MKLKLLIIITVVAVCTVVLILTQQKDYAQSIKPAFGAEFLTRPDGYTGLKNHYNFKFKNEPKQMVDGLLYKALANRSVDIINGFATDGRIPAYELVCLEDDRNFFPPYYAAPLIRKETLMNYPQLKKVLNSLSGKITNEKMQQLNYQADEKGKKAIDIAREYLINLQLIEDNNLENKEYNGEIIIGSKEFTEQEILGEILSLMIEHNTNIKVKRKLNLGGTIICFNALKAGDLDLYPEYTGTGLVNILKHDVISDPEKVYKIVKSKFEQEYNLIWLKPFGFNNTYTLTMRKESVQKLGLKTITDLSLLVNKNNL